MDHLSFQTLQYNSDNCLTPSVNDSGDISFLPVSGLLTRKRAGEEVVTMQRTEKLIWDEGQV